MNVIKVLMIDDEENFLKIVKMNLEKTGRFRVKTLTGAREMIAVVEEFRPDIILIDILMPKIDGVQACELLNDNDAGKNIPIIVLSALDTDKDKLMMYKLGVVDFIVKPIERDELIAKIDNALRNR